MFISANTELTEGNTDVERDANTLVLSSFGTLINDNPSIKEELGENIGFIGSTAGALQDPVVVDILKKEIAPRLAKIDKEYGTQFAENMGRGTIIADADQRKTSMGMYWLSIDADDCTFVAVAIMVMSSKHPFDVYKTIGHFKTTDDQPH